jgi:hypothetical protein
MLSRSLCFSGSVWCVGFCSAFRFFKVALFCFLAFFNDSLCGGFQGGRGKLVVSHCQCDC